MGLFSKKPTAAQKNEINASLSRLMTIAKKLETTESIDKYFTEWDKYITEYTLLSVYERQGIKFNISLKKIHSKMLEEIPRIEKDVLNRGFDRMQRDSAKLTTDKGKKKKAEAFFQELKFYYPRLQPSTVEMAENLKRNCGLFEMPSTSLSSTLNRSQNTKSGYCIKCGAQLDNGALFCGKCGCRQ